MFVANSNFENLFLSGISSTGDRYYRAVELTGRLTWFIVTCVVQDEELEMLQSTCCSLDQDLLALLQPMPHSRAVSLQRVMASPQGDGRWQAQEINRVWRVASPGSKWVLVFEDDSGSESLGPWGEAVSEDLGERTLVYDAGQSALAGRDAMSELSAASSARSQR